MLVAVRHGMVCLKSVRHQDGDGGFPAMRRTFGLGLSFVVVLAVAVPPALAQQAASFNRLTTTRRETTAGPNRVSQNGMRSASAAPELELEPGTAGASCRLSRTRSAPRRTRTIPA